MGFVAEPEVYDLVFVEDKYKGMEVQVRSCSIGEHFAFLEMLYSDKKGREEMDELFGHFLPYIESWNLTKKDGTPIPVTLEGLTVQLDRKIARAIVRAWMRSVMEVDGPLGDSSTSGDRSVEASLPMEPPSESLAS